MQVAAVHKPAWLTLGILILLRTFGVIAAETHLVINAQASLYRRPERTSRDAKFFQTRQSAESFWYSLFATFTLWSIVPHFL